MSTLDNLGGETTSTAIEHKVVPDTLESLIEPEVTEEVEILEDKKPKVEEVEETETDELEEIEAELDEEDKEKKEPTNEELEELIQPVRRGEILAKYPKLFKDF